MVPLIMNALRNKATMGEIHAAMRRGHAGGSGATR